MLNVPLNTSSPVKTAGCGESLPTESEIKDGLFGSDGIRPGSVVGDWLQRKDTQDLTIGT